MRLLTNDLLTAIAGHTEAPCLSLYMPTHRHHPGNQEDPVRFQHLVKELRKALENNHSDDVIQPLLKPFEELGGNHDFWNHTLDGLAVFGAPGLFEVVGLQRAVRELGVLADSFQIKPLRRFLQSTDRYQILGLSLHEIKLFEGNRDTLDVVDLRPGVPETITQALGKELTEAHQTVAAYGGTGAQSASMSHGHGGRKDEADVDEDRFFRAIDRAILEHHSQPSGLPLMLAALPEHHGVFRQISHNPFLMDDGLKIHPDTISIDELRERAWEVFEPRYQERLAALADDFAVAKSKDLGLDDLAEVGAAAVAGRIATLLIEADREIAGRVHAGSGHVHFDDSNPSQGDDLLDDLGEWALKKGGSIVIVPSDRMPTKTGAAAICRY